jgi:hypothetical protein
MAADRATWENGRGNGGTRVTAPAATTHQGRRRLRIGVVVAACTLVAAVAPPTYAATRAPTRPAARDVANPRGKFLGVIPSKQAVAGRAIARGGVHALGTGPLTYHGGPVQHTSNVYAIFWKPVAFTLPAGYQATIARYFTDVAKFSFKPSNVYGSATQYYDITGTVKQPAFYSVTSKLAIADPQPYPASGCPNYQLDDGSTTTNCLTDAQITAEIARVITTHALPTGVNNNYFLFTPQNVASCFTANGLSSGFCYDPIAFAGFCAYHSSFLLAGKNVLYADMPYAALAGCASGQSPENNAADSVLNTVAHEHLETITDPLGTAWWDDTGDEIADKCNGDFGAPLGGNSFGQFNQVINTHDYWLQRMWSNRIAACVQRNTFAQPVAAFTFTPAAPVHGQQVSFVSTSHNPDATPLKFRWTFPGGATSALANPKFTFPAAATVTVTLVVWDAQGDEARVQTAIVVH